MNQATGRLRAVRCTSTRTSTADHCQPHTSTLAAHRPHLQRLKYANTKAWCCTWQVYLSPYTQQKQYIPIQSASCSQCQCTNRQSTVLSQPMLHCTCILSCLLYLLNSIVKHCTLCNLLLDAITKLPTCTNTLTCLLMQ